MTNKPRFAPVCPAHVYAAMDVWDKGHEKESSVLGDYFLLLAHDVVENAASYARVFKERDCTIIMDNSVIELGSAVNINILEQACDIVGADVLAIPDVLCDGKATIETARAFVSAWCDIDNDCMAELMFIPQGNSVTDYLECVQAAVEFQHNFTWVGIARNLVPRLFKSRMEAIEIIQNYLPAGKKLHLLGFSGDPEDDILCTKSGFVEGIDSAVPLRMGSANLMLERGIVDPGPRGDWWETVFVKDLMMTNILAMRRLIGEMAESTDGIM